MTAFDTLDLDSGNLNTEELNNREPNNRELNTEELNNKELDTEELRLTRRRLDTEPPNDNLRSWIATAVVVLIAAILRLVRLDQPRGQIFDEIYYAVDAHNLLQHGVEWDANTNSGAFVAHPPLGKWLIAAGESLFGYDELGWRISSAVAGITAVLILTRVTRRLLRSTVLGCAAGLLMALDGLQLVLSRVALLDIFLLTLVLGAFAALVVDRDQKRRRWLAALQSGTERRFPRFVPWWRLLSAVLVGCALAVKWSALWYLISLLLLCVLWEVGLRRSAGISRPWRHTLSEEGRWIAGFCMVAAVVYLACWSGWFLTDDGWGRHWLRDSGQAEPPLVGALYNFWHYQWAVLHFHDNLSEPHPYQSWPWQWLLLGRPVLMQWDCAQPCAVDGPMSTVLLLGTPVLWWSFLPMLLGLVWVGTSRRDWRAFAIGLLAMAGILPWFPYEEMRRTMFAFYAAPAEPFLIMAVVYVLGTILRAVQRTAATIAAGGYVLIVAICFAYFYPIYVSSTITYAQWLARMWLGSRWI